MRRIRSACCTVCAVLLVVSAVASGALVAQDPVAPQDPVAAMMKTFTDAGLVVDAKAGTIEVPAVMARPADPLEFVLVHQRGKAHESLLVTNVKASVLNGAMLLLGFEPGENVRSVEKDPLPTAEEVSKGASIVDVFPPKGMPVYFTVKWTRIDGDGNEVPMEAPLEDLILDFLTERPIEDVEWIYLGGNMAPMYRNEPPVFLGDYEGNLVSNVYRAPPNHLVTIKHEGADDDERWWITNLAPPPDTPVTLVIHKSKTKAHAEREARITKRKADEAAAKKSDKDGESGR